MAEIVEPLMYHCAFVCRCVCVCVCMSIRLLLSLILTLIKMILNRISVLLYNLLLFCICSLSLASLQIPQ